HIRMRALNESLTRNGLRGRRPRLMPPMRDRNLQTSSPNPRISGRARSRRPRLENDRRNQQPAPHRTRSFMPESIPTRTYNHDRHPKNPDTVGSQDCGESTHACNTCQRPADTANNACSRCLNRYKQTLADIDHALAHPMAPILHLKATRYDASTRAGGDHMPLGVGQELDDPEQLAAQ